MRRLVALLVVAALLMGAKPAASGPQSLHFDLFGFTEKQDPVEQYSDWPWLPGPLDCSATEHCIVNPTPCSWDVDDHWTKFALNGYLPAGGSASDTSCLIASQNPTYRTVSGMTAWWSTVQDRFDAEITAGSPALDVSVAWSPQGRTFTLSPTYDAAQRLYVYHLCVNAVYSPGDPALVPIVGSNASLNGGPDALGVPSTVTFTVHNPTGKKVQGITGRIAMTGSAACVLLGRSAYPFVW